MNERQTQCERLLNFLMARENRWVPLPEIMDLRLANYRARISELRQRGHNIENEKRRADDGILHSWYRLVTIEVRTPIEEFLFPRKPIDSYLAME